MDLTDPFDAFDEFVLDVSALSILNDEVGQYLVLDSESSIAPPPKFSCNPVKGNVNGPSFIQTYPIANVQMKNCCYLLDHLLCFVFFCKDILTPVDLVTT